MFEAWSKPELFQRWWVPKSMGMKLHSCEIDVRTGGEYRLNFGDGMDFFGRYIEVTPPSRIVWTNDEGGEHGSVTTTAMACACHFSAGDRRPSLWLRPVPLQ